MAVTLVLISVGLILFHVWIRYGRIGRTVDKIPGTYPLPIFGNIFNFAGDKEQVWKALRKVAQDYSITRLWFLTRAWIVVRDPDDIKILLSSKVNLNKGSAYALFRPWLRTGLLISDRETWAQRRKIIKTGFYANAMRKYMEIADQCAGRFVETIKLPGDESVLSLLPLFSHLTLQIVCESTLGIGFAKLDKKRVQQYQEAIHDMLDIIMYRGTRPYITNWMMRFLPIGRRQNSVVKILHDFTNSIVQERREYHANFKADEAFDGGTHKSIIMLDVLLSAERDGLIDAEGVKNEIDIFTAAAHEMTAVATTFALMLLAENSKMQDHARAEVIKVFDENGGRLDIVEIQKLEYLDRCVKETLRLYPTVLQIMRSIDEDVQLKKYLVPAGVDVLFLIYDLHRDPKHWPEPEKFDPDRFLPENVKQRHPYAYIPFSAGLRNCIGQKFGMFKMKVILAHILYNFHVEPVDIAASVKLEANPMLQLSRPVRAKFIKRNKN